MLQRSVIDAMNCHVCADKLPSCSRRTNHTFPKFSGRCTSISISVIRQRTARVPESHWRSARYQIPKNFILSRRFTPSAYVHKSNSTALFTTMAQVRQREKSPDGWRLSSAYGLSSRMSTNGSCQLPPSGACYESCLVLVNGRAHFQSICKRTGFGRQRISR